MDDLKILFDELLFAHVKTGLFIVIAVTLTVIAVTAVLTARYLKRKKEAADAE